MLRSFFLFPGKHCERTHSITGRRTTGATASGECYSYRERENTYIERTHSITGGRTTGATASGECYSAGRDAG